MQLLFGVKSAKYEDGTSLADVMTWNHYGTETIPPRPVLRIAAENVTEREDIKDALGVYLYNVLVNPKDADQLEKENGRLMDSISESNTTGVNKNGMSDKEETDQEEMID